LLFRRLDKKGYTTNLTGQSAEFVIDAYHQLWRIEKSFRMSKHDLQARPIYHHKRESIDAHLTIVFAALAVSHWIEHQTGWSIKKFVRTTRRYRTVQIRAGRQTLTAADRLPDDLRDILAKINADHAASSRPAPPSPKWSLDKPPVAWSCSRRTRSESLALHSNQRESAWWSNTTARPGGRDGLLAVAAPFGCSTT
jgi:hypothetical protein